MKKKIVGGRTSQNSCLTVVHTLLTSRLLAGVGSALPGLCDWAREVVKRDARDRLASGWLRGRQVDRVEDLAGEVVQADGEHLGAAVDLRQPEVLHALG